LSVRHILGLRSTTSFRLYIFLGVTALIALVGQTFLSSNLSDQHENAIELRLAGRQRALVQELRFAASSLLNKDADQGETGQKLDSLLKLWSGAHKGYVNREQSHGLSGSHTADVEATLKTINGAYFKIQELAGMAKNENAEMSLQELSANVDAYDHGMGSVIYLLSESLAEKVESERTHSLLVNGALLAWLIAGFFLLIRPVLKKVNSQGEALIEAEMNVEHAHQVKSEFLANMSHEIRTPLNGIIGNLDLFEKSNLTAEQKYNLSAIKLSSESLLTTLNAVLDYSKAEAGMLSIDYEPFDLNGIINEVIDLLRPQATSKKLELLVFVDPAVPAHLIGDSTRLRQVLINLVSNSIKFTESGEVVVKVEKLASESGMVQLQFSVADTGIGIAPDVLPLLFNSFTQADSSTSRKYGGAGLGLAICKTLVEAMGGRIWVNSSSGKGSTFVFTLVVGETVGIADDIDLGVLDGLKALVVDDNTTNLKILIKQLSSFGIQATPFNSPELVLEVLPNLSKFDFCIVDMQMPGIDGVMLTRKIREVYNLDELPIIIVSSTAGTILADGEGLWNSYVTKPIKQLKLMSTIRKTVVKTIDQRSGRQEMPGLRKNHLQVLIAEENDIHQAVLKRTLEVLGHKADRVSSASALLDRVAKVKYDLVLLDTTIGDGEHAKFAESIRKAAANTEVPFIAGISADENQNAPKKSSGLDGAMNQSLDAEVIHQKLMTWFADADGDH